MFSAYDKIMLIDFSFNQLRHLSIMFRHETDHFLLHTESTVSLQVLSVLHWLYQSKVAIFLIK